MSSLPIFTVLVTTFSLLRLLCTPLNKCLGLQISKRLNTHENTKHKKRAFKALIGRSHHYHSFWKLSALKTIRTPSKVPQFHPLMSSPIQMKTQFSVRLRTQDKVQNSTVAHRLPWHIPAERGWYSLPGSAVSSPVGGIAHSLPVALRFFDICRVLLRLWCFKDDGLIEWWCEMKRTRFAMGRERLWSGWRASRRQGLWGEILQITIPSMQFSILFLSCFPAAVENTQEWMGVKPWTWSLLALGNWRGAGTLSAKSGFPSFW